MQDASEDAGEVGPGASFYRIESESPFGQTSSARASTTPRACGYICTGRARRYIQHLAMTAPTRRRGRSQNGFREKLVLPITPITLGRKQRRLLLSCLVTGVRYTLHTMIDPPFSMELKSFPRTFSNHRGCATAMGVTANGRHHQAVQRILQAYINSSRLPCLGYLMILTFCKSTVGCHISPRS